MLGSIPRRSTSPSEPSSEGVPKSGARPESISMLNAKWHEQFGSQPKPSGFEPHQHRQFEARVAGRTPGLSSLGTTGSSPVRFSSLLKCSQTQ